MTTLYRRWEAWFPRYRENLTLALPVVLAQVGQVVVQLADNAMVGRLGALPLAAVSFGGALFTLFLFWGTGLTLGLTPLAGEAYARGEHRTAAGLFHGGLLLYTGVGIGLLALMLGLGTCMERMGQDPAVVAMARPYYHYLAWSILPVMLFGAFKQLLEGIGNTRTGMVVLLSANVLNITLNYLFIYGHAGFPAMGAAGAGLATLVARSCMPLMMLGYFLWCHPARRYLRLGGTMKHNLRHFGALWNVGFPIAMQMLLEVSAFALTMIMMGWLGRAAMAAHQIVITLVTLVFMMQVGIAAATTILVSHRAGRGDPVGLRRTAVASYHLSLMMSVVTMGCFILLRHHLARLFTVDEAVIALAAPLFVMAALFQVADGFQVVSVGILRGMQDVRVTMGYAFLAYVLINLPVGYLCAFTLKLGPPGLWVGFIVGLSTAALLLYRRFRRQLARMPDTAEIT